MSTPSPPIQGRLREYRWLLTLLAAYLAARIVVLARADVFTSFDSAGYAPRGDAGLDHGPVLSFTGHAPRLWGVPLFYAILPDDRWRAAGQWAVGTLAWATLAVVVWRLCRHTAARLLAAAGVLLLALVDNISSLDFAILSESLTVNLGVLVVALLVHWLDAGTRWSLIAMTVAAFWWTFTRPDMRVFTIMVVIVLAACAWRMRERRLPAAVAGGVLAIALGWCTAIAPVATAEFQQWGALGTDQDEELFLVRMRNDVFARPYVREAFADRFGMPPCPGAQRSAENPVWDLVEFADEYHRCPDLQRWGEANADVFTRFPVRAPVQYLRLTYEQSSEALAGGDYANVPSVLPRFVRRAAFPGPHWSVPATLGLLALAVAGAAVTGAYRQRRVAAWSASVVAAACILSVVAVASAAGAQYWRYGVQEAFGLRIAIIILVAVTLDLLLERRAERAEPDARSTVP